MSMYHTLGSSDRAACDYTLGQLVVRAHMKLQEINPFLNLLAQVIQCLMWFHSPSLLSTISELDISGYGLHVKYWTHT